MIRSCLTVFVLVLTACGPGNDKCATVRCGTNQTCDSSTGMCVNNGGGGGSASTGGGSGTGGTGGSGGSGTGGGTAGSGGSGGAGGTGGAGGAGGAGGGTAVVIMDGGMLAAGETCGSAATMMPNTVYTSTTLGLTDDYNFFGQEGRCNGGEAPNTADGIFKITVPPGQRLITLLTSSFDAVINFVEAPATNCGTTTNGETTGIVCLNGIDYNAANQTEFIDHLNTSSTPKDLFVMVDGYDVGDEGAFSIVSTFVTPPMGDFCSNAVALNAQLAQETWDNFGNDYPVEPNSCYFGMGPDRIYRLDIPAMNKVTVRVAPSVGDTAINILDDSPAGCATPVGCGYTNNDGVEAEPDQVTVTNASGAVRSVYVQVSLYGAPAPGETFALTTTFTPLPTAPPPGDTCATATAITPGMLTGQTTRGFYDDYSAVCTGANSSIGPERVYSISVNPGQTLSATVSSEPSDAGTSPDFVLYLVGGPAGNCSPLVTSCLAAKDTAFGNGSETVTYTNDGGAAQSVFVVVDEYNGVEIGAFRLDTTLTP